ncbi:MAG: DUF72 domain-containing protein [Rhodospirillales bacterium]|nr:MAG: DUF72 domain-containing protein [Rhodospirillales bacterium]
MTRFGSSFIGTSGWRYQHWLGPVYPDDMPLDDALGYYAGILHAVEVNSTFYGLPQETSIDGWLAATPPGFVFAVKASRYLTHMKKLKDPGAGLQRFMDAVGPLGERLGPILFQLPPRWRCNPERLANFLTALPSGQRYAFEFRDPSWHNDSVAALLEARNAAFCVFELAGMRAPRLTTADFVYIRLHGPAAAYRGRYDGRALRRWAERIGQWCANGLDVYCFFDNDEAGYAFENAAGLAGLVAAAKP